MNKQQFIAWLQGLITGAGFDPEIQEYDAGNVWRRIDDMGLLMEIDVRCEQNPVTSEMFFRCSDGFLSSQYWIGEEDRLIWVFEDGDVNNNIAEVEEKHILMAADRANRLANRLRKLADPGDDHEPETRLDEDQNPH